MRSCGWVRNPIRLGNLFYAMRLLSKNRSHNRLINLDAACYTRLFAERGITKMGGGLTARTSAAANLMASGTVAAGCACPRGFAESATDCMH